MQHISHNNHTTDEPAREWRNQAYQSASLPGELPPGIHQDLSSGRPEREMSTATKASMGILLIAAIAGVLGDTLLREIPWGINLLLWVGLVAIAVVMFLRWQRQVNSGVPTSAAMRANRWLLIPLLIFAGGFSWRDSATLRMLDFMGFILTLSLMAFRSRTGMLLRAGISDYVVSLMTVITGSLGGAMMLLFSDIRWREVPHDGWSKHLGSIFRGVLIAVPLLFIFGTLLVSADEIFGRIVSQAFSFDAPGIVQHALIIAGTMWMVGGFLRLLLASQKQGAVAGGTAQRVSVGIIEVGIVLSLLDTLFLAFVVVQFRYLFGGEQNIPRGSGLAYAEYARSGFFELVTVTGLVLPLLLFGHWILKKERPLDEMIFRVLAGAQILLLFVMMASAVRRMRMYQFALGMTELRFYTMAFMGWLAIVFIWFALTVLRGQRDRFAFGSAITAFAMIVALNTINPDALIAQVNLERAIAGRPADLSYTTSLSLDAVPTLVKWLPQLKPEDRALVVSSLSADEKLRRQDDWRAWNWSRMQAKKASSAVLQHYSAAWMTQTAESSVLAGK